MNQHVGMPSERLVFNVTVEKIVKRETEFGPIGDHTMRTKDGDLLFWSASEHARWLEVGVQYAIKATIKDHLLNENRERQTIVLRVEETVEPVRVARVAVGLSRGSPGRVNPSRRH